MTNLEIIRKLHTSFAEGRPEKMKHFIAEDARWNVVGSMVSIAEDAFCANNCEKYFIDPPHIHIKQEIEKENYIAIEGEVKCRQADGGILDAFFFDVYRLEDGKIKELNSYIISKKFATHII
jgi:ketosteroid isomerase-like protein